MLTGIVSFYTNADALAARKVLSSSKDLGRLVPLPRSISAGCGYAWRTDGDKTEQVRSILEKEKIKFENITLVDLP